MRGGGAETKPQLEASLVLFIQYDYVLRVKNYKLVNLITCPIFCFGRTFLR